MVGNAAKPRGRPRQFDETDALDRAMAVFWAKGYDGTTVDDLVAGTGVGRPSLYATFGDKETLFLKCLDRYLRRAGETSVAAFHAAPTAREAVGAFLRQTVMMTAADGGRGCMMGNVASVVTDPKVREFTVRAMELPARFIEQRFAAGVADGELPAGFPSALRARQVVDFSMGLALRARLGASREALLDDAEQGVTLFFAGRSPFTAR